MLTKHNTLLRLSSYLRRSSPSKPACRIVKLSESGETIMTVSSEYWVSRIDISWITRTNTSATLSFGVPSSIGGGLMFWERLSDAYTWDVSNIVNSMLCRWYASINLKTILCLFWHTILRWFDTGMEKVCCSKLSKNQYTLLRQLIGEYLSIYRFILLNSKN